MGMRLKKQKLAASQDDLYKVVLQNGLQVYMLPKKGFKELSGILSVPVGSLDSRFLLDGQLQDYPAGIAHFLEHKLFEPLPGEDVSVILSHLGVETNAFTTYQRTNYVFSGISHLEESLRQLLRFVCQPRVTEVSRETVPSYSFTKESVDKECQIILQEINMYQDDPDARLYKGILGNLYPQTQLALDIAGSGDSVSQIGPDDLVRFHSLFYQVSRMTLFVVGDFKPSDLYAMLEGISLDKVLDKPVKIEPYPIEHAWVLPTKSTSMELSKPKLAVGFRGRPLERDLSVIRHKLALQLFFNMLLGWTSTTYQKWYEAGKIDDSFDMEIEVSDRYQFVILVSDTEEPIALSNRIRRVIRGVAEDSNLNPDHFESLKREFYGEFLSSLDHMDSLVTQFVTYLSDKELYFDLPDQLAQLSFEETVSIGMAFLKTMDMTDFTVFPK